MQIENCNTDKTSLLKALKMVGEIRTIFDCGSRDALDGIELYRLMNAKELHVFECNPPSIKKCRLNLEGHLGKSEEKNSWFLCESALNDAIGKIKFNQIDTNKTVTPHVDGNPGASSILIANKDYTNETYVQNEIDVDATTINCYSAGKIKPDCLWLDLQGVELKVLKAANEVLDHVKLIHVEVAFRRMYKDQCLYWELNKFLIENSFELFDMSIGRWPKLLGLYKFIGTGPWVGNAVYINKRFMRQ